MHVNRTVLLGLAGIGVYLCAAIYITYPLIFHLGDRTTGYGDELVIAWIQNWVIHALSSNPLKLFEANLYYPYHNTLAFTETFTLTSILAWPALLLIGQPIATVNFTLISSLVLLGFSIYILCFYLTKNFLISLFSGLLVIFSPAVLDYVVHLQVLSLECVPISILFFIHFVKTGKSRFLALSLLFLLLQMYNSIMPVYYILFANFVIFLFHWRAVKSKVRKLISRRNVALLALTALFMIPIAVPYFSVSSEFNYVRDIRDSVHLGLQFEDLLYPGITTRFHEILMKYVPTNHYSQNGEFKPGYLGLVFTLLEMFSLAFILRNFKKNSWYLNAFFIISLLGLIISLGAALHLNRHTVHKPFIIPLPYAVLYYIMPGFQGFRNAARWNMLFIIGAAVSIAIILNQLTSKTPFKQKVALVLFLIFGVIAEYKFPMKFFSVPQKKDFPKVYSWLASTKADASMIELPIYNWDMNPFTTHELWREYYNTENFRRTVNGYTGFSPPPWQKMVTTLTREFPTATTVNELRRLGIDYVIIHTDEYDALSKSNRFGDRKFSDGKRILQSVASFSQLKLVKRFEPDTYVYSVQ